MKFRKMITLLSAFVICALINGSLQAQSAKDLLNQGKDLLNQQGQGIKDQVQNGIKNATGLGAPKLTNEEIIKGLKEALSVGSKNSTARASKPDGFLKNALIFIPFPPEAQAVKSKLIQLGFQKKVTEFETSLNRAAEEASKGAASIFLDAIKGMTISDGLSILKGADTAATGYLRSKTHGNLFAKFLPIVKAAIEKVKVTSYWSPLVNTYNKIPGVKKQNPNLENYVTNRAIKGLFKLVADEETKIRKDPMARVTDILKKVFGSNDQKK